jgi:hypothetical protein
LWHRRPRLCASIKSAVILSEGERPSRRTPKSLAAFCLYQGISTTPRGFSTRNSPELSSRAQRGNCSAADRKSDRRCTCGTPVLDCAAFPLETEIKKSVFIHVNPWQIALSYPRKRAKPHRSFVLLWHRRPRLCVSPCPCLTTTQRSSLRLKTNLFSHFIRLC